MKWGEGWCRWWDSAISHQWKWSEACKIEFTVLRRTLGHKRLCTSVTFPARSHLVLPRWPLANGTGNPSIRVGISRSSVLAPFCLVNQNLQWCKRCCIVVLQEILINADMHKINSMLSETGLRTFNFGCSLIRPLSHSAAAMPRVFFHYSSIQTFDAYCLNQQAMQNGNKRGNGKFSRQVKKWKWHNGTIDGGLSHPLLDPWWLLTNSCCKTWIHQIIPPKPGGQAEAFWVSSALINEIPPAPAISNLQQSKVIFR